MKNFFLKLFLVFLITGVYAFGQYLYKNIQEDVNYCYAYWTPHGGYWQDLCYTSKKACKESFEESKSIGQRHNTKKCYKQKLVDAYCVGAVKTGKFRQDDFEGKEYEVLINVCTEHIDDCRKYEKYSVNSLVCKKVENVNTRESESYYLTSLHELEDIVNANKKSKMNDKQNEQLNKDIKKSEYKILSGCTKYGHAPNQQTAFENLGLNWNKTKKWGAFVDVDGSLRADKPSCRLIERNSEEYNRYK